MLRADVLSMLVPLPDTALPPLLGAGWMDDAAARCQQRWLSALCQKPSESESHYWEDGFSREKAAVLGLDWKQAVMEGGKGYF